MTRQGEIDVEVLEPHGFCAGVTGALRKALALSGRVWCLHELVHNEIVVADLRKRGFTFVEDVAEVPEGETVLFSAHGVAPAVREAAAVRRLRVVDATCPFVARVHRAARDFALCGLPVVVIGNPNHAEARGIVGEVEHAGGRSIVVRSVGDARTLDFRDSRAPGSACSRGASTTASSRSARDSRARQSDFSAVGVVSQTTMNADEVAAVVAALRERFAVETMAEVCQATKERQDAVRRFDGDALLVLGSANSSNTRRLCEVARCRTFRAGTLGEVKALDLTGVGRLGVTSGASTPESFFTAAVDTLDACVSRSARALTSTPIQAVGGVRVRHAHYGGVACA